MPRLTSVSRLAVIALCLGLTSSLRPFGPSSGSSRYVYPLAHGGAPPASPPIKLDSTAFPVGAEWGSLAQGLVERWYPKLCELLATDGRDPITGKPRTKPIKPSTVQLVIAKKLDVPAYTVGDAIHISGEWIAAHPEDSGLVIHELVHVLQRYPDSPTKPGWLVEGIADYVRWWRYEPELAATAGRTRIDPTTSKFSDGYRTTAVWLAWCSRTHDMRLVPALDLALRCGEDPMPLFEKLCGKSADALWKDFVAEAC